MPTNVPLPLTLPLLAAGPISSRVSLLVEGVVDLTFTELLASIVKVQVSPLQPEAEPVPPSSTGAVEPLSAAALTVTEVPALTCDLPIEQPSSQLMPVAPSLVIPLPTFSIVR